MEIDNPGMIDWPHAPPHWLVEKGTYFITATTYEKMHHFRKMERLDYLLDLLLEKMDASGWDLEAWALFSNHYHLILKSPEGDEHARSLSPLIKGFHGASSRWVNKADGITGRQVWQNYRETRLKDGKSYFARLHYVIRNPIHHGLVPIANQYPWCSAAWFEREAPHSTVRTVYGFKTDLLEANDQIEVKLE